MCGIVGVLTSDTRYNGPLNRFFKQALFADTLRGVDSTGIAVMDMTMDRPETFKKAMAAPDFLQLSKTDQLLDDLGSWNIMLGHNRAATRGGVKHHTAHPFQEGDITLVHNGTVINHRQLTGGNMFQVDSEAIAHAVGIDGIASVVSKLDGAFTLVWHDASDNSVNFIRNKDRPLYVGVEKGGASLVFASEGNMLKWLAGRNSIVLESLFQPEVGDHYKYFVGASEDWATNPEIVALPLRPAPIYGGALYEKKSQTATPTTVTTGTTATMGTTITTKSANEVVPYIPPLSPVAKSLLDEIGVKEDVVLFIPTEIKPIINDNPIKKGVVTGFINENFTNHKVKMFDIPMEDWAEMEGNVVVAHIVSCFKVTENSEDGKLVYTVICSPNDYITYDWNGSQLTKEPDEDEIAHLVKGPQGLLITEEIFEEYTKHGCDMCTGNIYVAEASSTQWTSDNQPICSACAKENDWDY